MSQTLVLTGITGFIAKNVALNALNRGHSVRGTLRSPRRADEVRAALAPHLTDRAALDRLSFHVADLGGIGGWAEAMAGADALLHTASPFPLAQPKDEQELIRPAVEGTTRVLRAALAAGIRRAVLTSSTAAVLDERKQGEQDERDWCQPDLPTTSAYSKSKVLAEQAAWEIAGATDLALTTINPGLVLGPPLDAQYGSSLNLVLRLLKGKDPALPLIGFPVVDVRDIAEMHLRALEQPETAGQRFIGSAGSLSMPQMAAILKAAYPQRRIPTRTAPRWLLRVMALWDAEVRTILPQVGMIPSVSSTAARRDLRMDFIPADQALLASAAWLIEQGQV